MNEFSDLGFIRQLLVRIVWLLERLVWGNKRTHWDQLEHAVNIIGSDRQWLAHDPVSQRICVRHLQAVTPKWRSIAFKRSSDFRSDLGLCPHTKTK